MLFQFSNGSKVFLFVGLGLAWPGLGLAWPLPGLAWPRPRPRPALAWPRPGHTYTHHIPHHTAPEPKVDDSTAVWGLPSPKLTTVQHSGVSWLPKCETVAKLKGWRLQSVKLPQIQGLEAPKRATVANMRRRVAAENCAIAVSFPGRPGEDSPPQIV